MVETAKQLFDRYVTPEDGLDAVERLRAFCSFAMRSCPQDWIDVEPFFDDLRPIIADAQRYRSLQGKTDEQA